MKLYLYNYTITPAIVRQIVFENEKVVIKELSITEKGIYNPVCRLLKVGSFYPTPNGMLPIKGIELGCLTF